MDYFNNYHNNDRDNGNNYYIIKNINHGSNFSIPTFIKDCKLRNL